MLGKIIGSGQLGKLASFVSPAFFDVMPAGALWSRARRLYALTRDRDAHEHAVKERAAQLKNVMPEVQLAGPRDKVERGPHDATGRDANWRASVVVELYFRQLFLPGPTLLDLRSVAFTQGSAGLTWKPAPWLAEWSNDFIEPLRELYRGFYTHDDEQFRHGLAALSLSHSEDLFRAQFGADQQHVVFRTQNSSIFFIKCSRAAKATAPSCILTFCHWASTWLRCMTMSRTWACPSTSPKPSRASRRVMR